MEQISFKERVANAINSNAKVFDSVFLKYEYLICSEAFPNKYHLITAHEGNYLHLTGVHTNMSPDDFYYKSAQNQITINDFDFIKSGAGEKSVKGSVREKIKVLPYLEGFFASGLRSSEGFLENRVSGTFSSSNEPGLLTIGFVANGNPMSLLKGDKLKGQIKNVDVILRRKRIPNVHYFDEIICGDTNILKYYMSFIKEYVSPSFYQN